MCTQLCLGAAGAEISSEHMESREAEVPWEPGCGKSFSRTEITSKSLLGGEPPVNRGSRQVTGVNRTRIWAGEPDRLRLQMVEKEEKGP